MATSISTIKGMNPDLAAKLKAEGISNTDQLLDAAAKASDKGAAVGGEAVLGGITIYQLTKSGLALQATVKGTKYWKDDDLN